MTTGDQARRPGWETLLRNLAADAVEAEAAARHPPASSWSRTQAGRGPRRGRRRARVAPRVRAADPSGHLPARAGRPPEPVPCGDRPSALARERTCHRSTSSCAGGHDRAPAPAQALADRGRSEGGRRPERHRGVRERRPRAFTGDLAALVEVSRVSVTLGLDSDGDLPTLRPNGPIGRRLRQRRAAVLALARTSPTSPTSARAGPRSSRMAAVQASATAGGEA